MIHYSHSSTSTWRRCRYRFYLQYIKKIRSPSSVGQMRGSAGHVALATWYQNELNDEEALKAAFDTFTESMGAEFNQEDWRLIEEALIRYFEWAKTKDKFKLLEHEVKFEIPIDTEDPNDPPFVLVGYIDGVIEDSSGIWLLENKFNKRVTTSHLTMDAQVSIYMIAALLLGIEPVGVLYNIIRMGDGPTAKKEPVVRQKVFRNKVGLRYKYDELISQMREIHKFVAEGGAVYRNETRDCSWDCSFYQACLSLTDSGEAGSVLERMKV